MAAPGTPVFLNVTGEKSSDITLAGNDLHYAGKVWTAGDDVGSKAVQVK